MRKFIQNTSLAVLVTLVAFTAFDYALSIPDVRVSYASRDCVGVDHYPGVLFGHKQYSCEQLPSRFNHVWVK